MYLYRFWMYLYRCWTHLYVFVCICIEQYLYRFWMYLYRFWMYLSESNSFSPQPSAVSRQPILTVFTVIALSVLTSGPAEEAAFDAIYGDPAHWVYLRTSLGCRFWSYLRWSRSLCSPQGQLRKHILTLFTVIAITVLSSGPVEEAYFDAIYGNPIIYVWNWIPRIEQLIGFVPSMFHGTVTSCMSAFRRVSRSSKAS